MLVVKIDLLDLKEIWMVSDRQLLVEEFNHLDHQEVEEPLVELSLQENQQGLSLLHLLVLTQDQPLLEEDSVVLTLLELLHLE